MHNTTILCFGDSNTWGYSPCGTMRYDSETRWPGVLQQELGDNYTIIEEGLCGRTTVWDDPIEGMKNGLKQLPSLLLSHAPLDLVIIMLGTNDLKNRFAVSALDVCKSVGTLVKLTQCELDPIYGTPPQVLVICPPPFSDMSNASFKDIFIDSELKSQQLTPVMESYCSDNQIPMLKASDYIHSSPRDGIHLETSEHKKLGIAIANKVKKVL